MKNETELFWGFSADEDTKDWYGSFSTREEAIREGAAWFNQPDVVFYIARGELIDVCGLVCAEDVVFQMEERLRQIGPEDGELEIDPDGEEVLGAFLEFWSQRYTSTKQWKRVGSVEKILCEAVED